MGYRHYFYKVKTSEVNEVKDMNFVDLCNYAKNHGIEIYDEGGFYFNDKKFLNKVEIFEFGKLYWDNTADRIYNSGVPLFTNEETQRQFEYYVPYIVGKQGLLAAIQIYKENVLKVYKDMLVDGAEYRMAFGITIKKEDVKPIDKIREHIEDKLSWIEHFDYLVDLDETKPYSLTKSWQYEHTIFNLVHLLKTIDWENETILSMGGKRKQRVHHNMKLRQLLCRHRYAAINLQAETKNGICVFTNKCVKCGKEYRAEIPEKNLYKEHKERAV